MTAYELKSLKLLAAIDLKLGLLVEAAGLTIPEEPERAALKISTEAIAQARHTRRAVVGPNSWMGR
jgi:hypothetical protein